MNNKQHKNTKLIRIGEKYHKAIKKEAVEEMKTMTRIIEDLIKEKFNYEN